MKQIAKLDSSSRLGVDIGRVLISPGDGQHDTAFFGKSDDAAMQTPPMEGALSTLKLLIDRVGRDRVWLVSKCGPRIQRRSLMWLCHHDVYGKTGLRADHIRFCKERRDKANHARDLGLDAFIDDRIDVHRALDGLVATRVLFGPQKPRTVIPIDVLHAPNWAAIRDAL